MLVSGIPAKFNVPWGNAAGGSYLRTVPQASQIGVQDGAASLTDGFPPLTFTPRNSGGVPPFGADMNGILKQITQWNQWQAAGAPVLWDSAFSTAVGGYPKNSRVFSTTTDGLVWRSTADNNTTNPDTGGANWVKDSIITNTATAGYLQVPVVGNFNIIFQWARYSISPSLATNTPPNTKWGTQTVSWATTFPTGVISWWPGPTVTANGQFTAVGLGAVTQTSVDVYATCWDNVAVGLPLLGNVLAIGY